MHGLSGLNIYKGVLPLRNTSKAHLKFRDEAHGVHAAGLGYFNNPRRSGIVQAPSGWHSTPSTGRSAHEASRGQTNPDGLGADTSLLQHEEQR